MICHVPGLQRKTDVLLLILLSLFSIPGCSRGPAKPDDLPALTSCTLTILYKGSPLSDATVTLVPKNGNWVGVGQTGADGRVALQTNGRYEGVPLGTYAVTVRKPSETAKLPPDPTTPEEDRAYTEALKAAKSAKPLIPEKYAKPETSGLSVTVSESPLSETLELTD